MSKRYVDEKWRKPRVAKGTPLYKYSNLVSLGVIAVSGVCWYLYECWPGSKKIENDIRDGKFNFSSEHKLFVESMKYSKSDPAYHELIVKMQKRAYEREQSVREEPWYFKILNSTPEE